MSKFAVFLFLLINLLSCYSFARQSLMIKYKDKTEILQMNEPTLELSLRWQEIAIKDPNSGEKYVYYGYFFLQIINFFKKKWDISKIQYIETEAADGYKTEMPIENINSKNYFLALKIDGVSSKGIWNKFLKSYFDWRPSYLIFIGSGKVKSQTSPYQVKKIVLHNEPLFNPIVKNAAKEFKEGARIYSRSCAKCHEYQSFGGNKGPDIRVALGLHKKDKDLQDFLLNPQKDKKRSMSAFAGTPSELKQLLLFLRTIH